MMDQPQQKTGRTIAFDFDGVIASYSGFKGVYDIQEPNVEVLAAIRALKEKGHKILIHSTRGDEFIKNYCARFDVPYDFINRRPDKEGENPGKPIAFVYVDDRSICYRGQNAAILVAEIENFKAYWEE